MKIRDRIQELRRVKAGLLRPHPNNWRTHPVAQQDALRGVLAEIGYADALVARQLADGSLELIDGHLRAEITPEVEVPVLVVDLDDQEAAKLLAVHDPLTGLADTDQGALAELLGQVETDNAALQEMLDGLLRPQEPIPTDDSAQGPPPEIQVPEAYQVVIECRDEAEQKSVYGRMTAEGFPCRLLML